MIARYALRQIRRKPGFSLTVIVTLALGVGANLAVFQLLQGVLFTPLPIASPSQLYALHSVSLPLMDSGSTPIRRFSVCGRRRGKRHP